ESLAEGAGTGGEEQVEGLLCHLSKEEPAQLLRQGEGDEEVGGRQTPVELSRHPLRGGSAAALGAGAVVAAVVDEAARGALRADMQVPSPGRGAAMGDGPDGASPRLVAGREPRGTLRQETAQGVDDTAGHRASDQWGRSRESSSTNFSEFCSL